MTNFFKIGLKLITNDYLCLNNFEPMYSMKKLINYFMIRAISAIVLGVLLILGPKNAIFYVVIAIGILFIVPGLISLISYFTSERTKRPEIPVLLAGIGSLLFGVILVSVPYFFISVLMYLLGALLLLGGIEQIVNLIRARKKTTVPMLFYIAPLLVVMAGILVLLNPFKTLETLFILVGVTCLIYGVMEFVHWLKFKRKYSKEILPV